MFVSRLRYAVLQAEHLATVRELEGTKERLRYWQSRAEKMIEHGLARNQAIGQATMIEPGKAANVPPVSRAVVQAMSVQEFEETKK